MKNSKNEKRRPFRQTVGVFFLLLLFLAAGFLTVYLSGKRAGTASAPAGTGGAYPTVILDAGHGGEDGGAVGVNRVLEKDLNLAVTLRLADLLRAAGVPVILTRTEDRMLYGEGENIKGRKKEFDLKNRLRVAKDHPDAIFISIHMNNFPQEKYNGLQVYYAGHTATAADMGLLAICGPIFLILLSHFFLKTHIAFGQIVGLIIAVFGVITILIKGDFSQLSHFRPVRGDFIMLLNTFGFSVYSLMQSKRPKVISQISMLAVTAWVGVVMIVPFMLLTVPATRLENISSEDIGVMIYLGIFNSTFAYLCWNSALARLGNIKTAIIYYLLPIISGLEAYLFLGQKLFAAEIIGGLLIIVGITLVNLNKKAQS